MPEPTQLQQTISNFGGNICFTPRDLYAPATEAEVLEILDRHANGKVRVVGALHSWSPLVVCEDALVDLRHFDRVEVERGNDGAVWATVGGGCRIKDLLRQLHSLSDATIPSLGLITAQTIAGAISTATHGSGKHSLSHYMQELRVAAYDAASGKARIYSWSEGDELRAARCALGCMGIILAVRFRCIPRYDVEETIVACTTLDEVLAHESEFPLQQFYLIPHRWNYLVQRRRVAPDFRPRRRGAARWYRLWWFLFIDVGFHLVIKLMASVLKSATLIRFFYRHVLSKLILKNTTVVDHGELMLVMEHELFKHLEIEILVPARHLPHATAFIRTVLEIFDGTTSVPAGAVCAASMDWAAEIENIGMHEELLQRRGTFTHHYPIAFRRVLPDDALISMSSVTESSGPESSVTESSVTESSGTESSGRESSSTEGPYYAISFITYVEPRDRFLVLASFLARSMTRLFQARLHWGKYFPLSNLEIERVYPRFPEFRALCRQVDPNGVFRNDFTDCVI
jgi:hypothetical protein